MEYEYTIGQTLEKKWGRLNFKRFKNILPERFTVFINSRSYYSRTVDVGGRVWLGTKAFEGFEPKDKLLISIDKDVVHIRKKS